MATIVDEPTATAQDLAAIEKAARDLTEGFYAADADRVRRAVHPQLVNRYLVEDDLGVELLQPVPAYYLIGLAAAREHGRDAELDMVIDEALSTIATVRCYLRNHIDLLQIAKTGDEWKVLNVLWRWKHPDGEPRPDDPPLSLAAPGHPVDTDPADRAGVEAAALDYLEGWYEADPERMGRALHPGLVKRTVRVDEHGFPAIVNDPADTMVADTAAGGFGRMHEPNTDPETRLEIDDISAGIASIRAYSKGYVDYCQMVKTKDGWKIVNVLWRPSVWLETRLS